MNEASTSPKARCAWRTRAATASKRAQDLQGSQARREDPRELGPDARAMGLVTSTTPRADRMHGVDGERGTAPMTDGSSLDTFRELVTSAFEAARNSGRPDWQVMAAGVLKNRILQATAREFDERAYGAGSFTRLLQLIPDLVEVDHLAQPPAVRFLAHITPGPGDSHVVGMGRLRPDLWDAVLDYSSGGVYVWDGAKAVKANADEAADKPQLPTITAAVMAAWRRDFADRNEGRGLDEWVERGLGTMALPADLRRSWNATVKSKVIGILEPWFMEQGLQLPSDASSDPAARPSATESHEAEELRRFLQRCVAVMKPSELRAMQVPASVALRAKT